MIRERVCSPEKNTWPLVEKHAVPAVALMEMCICSQSDLIWCHSGVRSGFECARQFASYECYFTWADVTSNDCQVEDTSPLSDAELDWRGGRAGWSHWGCLRGKFDSLILFLMSLSSYLSPSRYYSNTEHEYVHFEGSVTPAWWYQGQRWFPLGDTSLLISSNVLTFTNIPSSSVWKQHIQ